MSRCCGPDPDQIGSTNCGHVGFPCPYCGQCADCCDCTYDQDELGIDPEAKWAGELPFYWPADLPFPQYPFTPRNPDA